MSQKGKDEAHSWRPEHMSVDMGDVCTLHVEVCIGEIVQLTRMGTEKA